MPGWSGTDCAVPVCASCGQGFSVLLGACKCREGCAKPTPHAALAAAMAVGAVAVVLGGLVAVAVVGAALGVWVL